jgi:hypothetical protein
LGYWSREEYDKGGKILKDYIKAYPGIPMIHLRLAFDACFRNDFDLALQECETAQRLERGNFDYLQYKIYIIFAKGDLAAYSKMMDEYLGRKDARGQSTGRQMHCLMRRAQGRHVEAEALLRDLLAWWKSEENTKALGGLIPPSILNSLLSACRKKNIGALSKKAMKPDGSR